MVDRIGPIPISQAIARGAEASGASFELLVKTAGRESSFNPAAKAPTSSASGLFQFIESTWLEMVGRHGAKHGLGREAAAIDLSGPRPRVATAQARADILALRFDPELAARMAGELTRENAAHLAKSLGRTPKAGELYAAHVMGAGGAARLIKAAEAGAADASALFPKEAAANPWLFYDKQGAPRSAEALLARLDLDPSAPAAPAQPAPAAEAGEAEAMAFLRLLLDMPGFFSGEAEPMLRQLADDAYGRAGRL